MRPALYPVLFRRPLRGGPDLDLNFAAMTVLDPRVTYTGASLATLTDATGAIAYKPHNLFVWSSDFSNAAWQKPGGGTGTTTVTTPNYGTAPDGTLTASRFVADKGVGTTEGDYSMMLQTIPSAIGPYTGAIYAKSNTGLSQDVLVYVAAGGQYNKQVVSVGNTWVRLSPATTTSAGGTGGLVIGCRGGSAPGYSGGQQSLDLLVWGAQFNLGPLQPYYPTTSAAYFGPRFTYDPVTHAALGLLVEEQRTNLLLYSEAFDNAAWISSGMTISSNAIAAPDGLTTADQITLINGSHSIRQNPDATVAASTQYTLSFYAYRGTATDAKYAVFDNTHAAHIFTSTSFFAQMSASGWSRVTVTFTTPAGCTSIRPVLLSDSGVTGTIYIWGAQLEAGAFATSYIPTTSASVTRAADSATMTGSNFSSWFNATNGTVAFEAISSNTGTGNEGVVTFDQDGNNTIGIGRRYAGGGSTNVGMFVFVGGVTQAYIQTGTVTPGTAYKVAARYALNNFAESVNGGAPSTDIVGTLPGAITQMLIGRTYASEYLNGTISRLRYYNTALTNAQLQALTT